MTARKHVLVVDDDDVRIMMMRGVFERHGLRVSAAVDGRDALRQLAVEEVDLVVTDLHMPHCDGAELIATLRRLGKSMPVIVVSSDEEGSRTLVPQDGVLVLRKTGSLDEVLAAVALHGPVDAALSCPATRRPPSTTQP